MSCLTDCPSLIQHVQLDKKLQWGLTSAASAEHTTKNMLTDAQQRPDIGWWATVDLLWGPKMTLPSIVYVSNMTSWTCSLISYKQKCHHLFIIQFWVSFEYFESMPLYLVSEQSCNKWGSTSARNHRKLQHWVMTFISSTGLQVKWYQIFTFFTIVTFREYNKNT